MTPEKLIERAKEAMQHAYAPYSGYKVGAALLCADGTIYQGCNIENAAYGPTICAERSAIFNMLTHGEDRIARVLALMPDGSCGAPCGACRELMVQLMPGQYRNVEIMMDYKEGTITTLGELTPQWWIP